MAAHSSTLTYRNPWTEELGRLWSTGSQELDKTLATKPLPVGRGKAGHGGVRGLRDKQLSVEYVSSKGSAAHHRNIVSYSNYEAV